MVYAFFDYLVLVMCEVSQNTKKNQKTQWNKVRKMRKFFRTHCSFPGWLNSTKAKYEKERKINFFSSPQCASTTSTVLHCSDNQCDRDKRSDEFWDGSEYYITFSQFVNLMFFVPCVACVGHLHIINSKQKYWIFLSFSLSPNKIKNWRCLLHH